MIWRKPPKQLTILQRWESSSCMLYQVESKLYGRVCTYRFVSKQDQDYKDLLLTLDSVFLLKQKGLVPKGTNPLATHYFAAHWAFGNPALPMQRISSYLLDLIGQNFWHDTTEDIAQQVIRNLALHILAIPPTKVESWTKQVERVNWLGLLQQFARQHKKLGERHQLIPGED